MTVVLPIKVLPGKNESKVIQMLENGTIKIQLNAVPRDGKANRELIRFLSKKLNIVSEKIKIIKGISSRNKLVKIESLENKLIYEKLFIDI